MDCLLVIDMQEDYVGAKRNKKRYPYDTESLINNINSRIDQYPAEAILYVTNKFFWELGKSPKELVSGLKISSEHIFMKKHNSSFSSQQLLNYLHTKNMKSLELVGVDGNYCVGATALDGVRKGFEITCPEACIGVGNKEKFLKMKAVLAKEGVKFI